MARFPIPQHLVFKLITQYARVPALPGAPEKQGLPTENQHIRLGDKHCNKPLQKSLWPKKLNYPLKKGKEQKILFFSFAVLALVFVC